ncbi:unnamed protein product [Rotaria sp. Silwood2]|nr:unnamed protein product [Rotaria sp. Silwood2]CAF4472861.1 unnamed protein product [Rotaria sp. Silwood2]
MYANSYQSLPSDAGIIFLGNAGSGKSFLCNCIIGHEQFEHDFRTTAVTTVTEYHEVNIPEKFNLRIYNISGSVEANQKRVEENKRQIMKAFEECPNSIVIFVWTQNGGRVNPNDVVAFNALNAAYAFPAESLAFVVNDLPPHRNSRRNYDGEFLATLKVLLEPMKVSVKDIIFIDHIEPGHEMKLTDARTKLLDLISKHYILPQTRCADIILELEQLQKDLCDIKNKQMQAEQDKEKFKRYAEQLQNELADSLSKQIKAEQEKIKAEKDKEKAEQDKKKADQEKEKAEAERRKAE